MTKRKNVFAIIGSASKDSLNQKIIDIIAAIASDSITINGFDLTLLPHFNPSQSINHPPPAVLELREKIQEADAVIICTPEYIFSIPALLKNAIEWCVATTVFSDKPVALITASSSGIKGHEQLKLIMNTVGASLTDETTLLISGVKSRINVNGEITDSHTRQALEKFVASFNTILDT